MSPLLKYAPAASTTLFLFLQLVALFCMQVKTV